MRKIYSAFSLIRESYWLLNNNDFFFFFFFFVQIPNERFEIIPLYLLEQIKFLSLTKMIKSQCLETENESFNQIMKNTSPKIGHNNFY